MGRISTGIGLVSGINSKDIIDQLMSLESRPKTLLQARVDTINQQKLAYTDLVARLTGLRLSATTLKKSSTFNNAATTSSDPDVLSATASSGAATGSFQFRVARLVTTQQAITGGFASTTDKVGAGTLTIEQGGGELWSQTPLAQLNGGAGVRYGQFRVTDRSGASAVIDINSAVTLDDVVKKINTALNVSVRASIGSEGLVLTDLSGQAAGNFIVQDLGGGHAAEDLGIIASAASSTINGSDINYLGRSTLLTQLNDGRGVGNASGLADFQITASDGTLLDIDIDGQATIGGVLDAINNATNNNGKVRADVAPGGNGIRLTDLSGGGGAFTVAAANGSTAAADLGLLGTTASGGVISGDPVIASLNTVLISTLRGGTGLPLGQIRITDRTNVVRTVDLSSAKTVQDILDRINGAGLSITASLKASGNGIQITDTSSGANPLLIEDVDSTTAAALGIAGSFGTGGVSGANLQRQWVTRNTLLSSYNGGKGVSQGKFRITDSSGKSAVVDLTQGNEVTLNDVIKEINSRGIGVTASINANGDGLLLTDTAGGTAKLKVDDVEGAAAADLNIKGQAAATTIDGSFEKTIAVTATDTLDSVQTKINQLGFGLAATTVNDGSGLAPYRLSLSARNAGRAGRFVFDAGGTALQARNLVEAQDAAVFLGNSDAAQPLLITSGHNQISNVVRGVTIDLHGVSDQPVTLNISRTPDNVADEMQKFADNFNQLVDRIDELTKFDTDTNQRGLLLGESPVQQIETEMYSMLRQVVSGAGKYRTIGDVGLTVGPDAKLSFDPDKFRAAYADDPDAIQRLFTQRQSLTPTTLLASLNMGRGIALGRFKITNSAGVSATVDLTSYAGTSIGGVIAAINGTGLGVTAALNADGNGLVLTDAAGGAGKLTVTDLFKTTAADLKISGTASSTTLGGAIGLSEKGLASVIERSITRLIDPVNGVISRQNKTLDERVQTFQDRMGGMDKLLEAKRARLERQFANMESVLAGLQSQQSALSSLSTLPSLMS